jgi:hypothetical protein
MNRKAKSDIIIILDFNEKLIKKSHTTSPLVMKVYIMKPTTVE